MRSPDFFVIASLLLASTANAGAQDKQAPTCGPFTVLAEIDAREIVDLGAEGPSAGDLRIGRYILQGESGDQRGTMHFSATLMPAATNGQYPVFVTSHYQFANGALTTIAVVGLPDTAGTEHGPDGDLEYAITGGTGVFAQASGTLSTKTAKDSRRKMRFDLTCRR